MQIPKLRMLIPLCSTSPYPFEAEVVGNKAFLWNYGITNVKSIETAVMQ